MHVSHAPFCFFFFFLLLNHFMTITEFTWSCMRLGGGVFPARNTLRGCKLRTESFYLLN